MKINGATSLRLSFLLLFCAQLLHITSASSFTPESGFYGLFTDNARGRGGTALAVEIQNDYLFAAGFLFRTDGTPTYVTIEGPLKHNADGSWGAVNAGGLAAYSGGQCIGTSEHCPYRAPTAVSIGGFAIRFTAENEGTLTWGAPDNQASVTLRRDCIGSLCYDAPTSLLGEWDIIVDHPSKIDGLDFGADRLAIAEVEPSGDSRTISGCVDSRNTPSPTCSTAQKMRGVAERCVERACTGFQYRLDVLATKCDHRCKIVRVYRFEENGHGGAFGWSFHGDVGLCPNGATTFDACFRRGRVPFVAHRSGSIDFVRTGVGTH